MFFSKDRTERIVEPVLEEIYATVTMPRGGTDASGSPASKLTVRVLSRGEWMSGCPEGGEQSFLFQLYNFLSEGSMPCANRCGRTVRRKAEHFFPLFVSPVLSRRSQASPTSPTTSCTSAVSLSRRARLAHR